jgi:hypothetical protein
MPCFRPAPEVPMGVAEALSRPGAARRGPRDRDPFPRRALGCRRDFDGSPKRCDPVNPSKVSRPVSAAGSPLVGDWPKPGGDPPPNPVSIGGPTVLPPNPDAIGGPSQLAPSRTTAVGEASLGLVVSMSRSSGRGGGCPFGLHGVGRCEGGRYITAIIGRSTRSPRPVERPGCLLRGQGDRFHVRDSRTLRRRPR